MGLHGCVPALSTSDRAWRRGPVGARLPGVCALCVTPFADGLTSGLVCGVEHSNVPAGDAIPTAPGALPPGCGPRGIEVGAPCLGGVPDLGPRWAGLQV